MDDRLLLLQIAFALVAGSADYLMMSIDNRVDEVKRVYGQLNLLVEGKDGKDSFTTVQ